MEEFSSHLRAHFFGTTGRSSNQRRSSSSPLLLQPSYYTETTTAAAATTTTPSSSSSVAPLIYSSHSNNTATDDLYHRHHQQQQQQNNIIAYHHHQPKPEEHTNNINTNVDLVEKMKKKIVAHPHYSNLLCAFMDCQKIGAPLEVAERLKAAAVEFESWQRNSLSSTSTAHSDPELDQFMEAYYHMLLKFNDELARPIQEAMDFFKRVESQLNSLTNGSSAPFLFSSSDANFGTCSSDEDLEGSGGESDQLTKIDPRAEERELKNLLLKKYSGYLGSLRQELSKKKKKGKLPKEAHQKLLNWWELHYKWPYPSESEKVALAESTGLDQKQISNWFINQRKRHWKPSEDMQFVVENYYPQHPTPFYVDGSFMGSGTFRFGP